jgi:hypothetical protein
MGDEENDRIVDSYEWDGDDLIVHEIVSVNKVEHGVSSGGKPWQRVVPKAEHRPRRIADPEEQQRVIAAGQRSGGRFFRY